MTARLIGIAACVLAVLLLGVALISGRLAESAPAPRPEAVQVSESWVRLPVVPGRPAAGYLTIAGGPSADRLVSVTSPKAQRIELHATRKTGGVMRMEKLSGLDVPAGGSVALAPGGHHLMIFGLDPSIKAGGTLPLTLVFERAGRKSVAAMVHAATDQPAGGHAHHH